MWRDPVVEEVRAIRDAYSKRFDYDLHAIAGDLRKKEKCGNRELVDPEPRKAENLPSRRSA